MILENTLKEASRILKQKKINSYELDAQIILSHVMGVTREFLILNDQINISKETKKKYELAIKRRSNSEPVAYITGKKEFWSQDFMVDQNTLIPRPETELLIYKIVNFYNKRKINILDIGTGSGCILLSVLQELKYSRGLGIDISPKAIQKAKLNSKRLNLINRSKFKVYDIDKFNIGKYDLIISNPPYIPTKDINKLSNDIKFYEPLLALNGGVNGLDLIKKVIYKSKYLIKKNGLLAIEIGNRQYYKVKNILKVCGFKEFSKVYDYEKNVRCIISTKL
tara:strand:- start:2072 stop:2911 length:840 start_codon:yes stop_codon:yes gene_type:complete